MELRGKTALLTGATGGLGRAIAGELAGRGTALVLSSRKPQELEQLAGALPGEGHTTMACDLGEEGAAERLIGDAGPIDILVANAGMPGRGRLDGFPDGYVERAIRVNLEAPVVMTRALLPALRERGSGHLVFISSLAGKAPTPRGSLYAATKFGLRGFALCLRGDVREEGIGVSVILPGFIREAGMFADSGATPPPGMGTSTPSEVGRAVAEAIERDRAEVEVAPLPQRLAAGFAHRRPQLAASLLSRGAASRAADRIAEGQARRREGG
jgi:short-subunit dehydrogenase